MRQLQIGTLLLLALAGASALTAQPYDSAYVRYNSQGKLDYTSGNRVPDFGYAGYAGGRSDPPATFGRTIEVRPRSNSANSPADDTALVQQKLDDAAALQPNPASQEPPLRILVLLKAGTYWIDGTLRIPSNVVLAGEGAQQTILRRRWLTERNTGLEGTALSKRRAATVVRIGRPNYRDEGKFDPLDFPANATAIIRATAPLAVGSRRLELPNTRYSLFVEEGVDLVIGSRATSGWFDQADPDGVARWRRAPAGTFDVVYQRRIVRVARNGGSDGRSIVVTLDAPIFSKLDTPEVFSFNPESVCRESGLERLTVTIDTRGEDTEGHAEVGVQMVNAENCWVRDVKVEHFSYAGVRLGPGVTRSSVLNCSAVEPHSDPKDPAAKRYNFTTGGAQLVLFENCDTSKGRHSLASNGGVRDSGIVFLNCRINRPLAVAEPHRHWAQGVLYDSVTVTNRNGLGGFMFALSWRGDEGASDKNGRVGHGWSAVNCVLWRCDADGGGILVQNPPLAQNYAIGCSGNVTGSWQWSAPIGLVEHTGHRGQMRIASLYRAQRAEAWPQTRSR